MLVKTKGIIFRSVKYKESSLILDIYTHELGLKTYVINGVRKKNAKVKAAILQLMNLVELEVYEHVERDINRIKEVRPSVIYRQIPFRIEKSAVGLFILEIVRKNIKEKEKNKFLFDFLEATFSFLDETPNSVANFHIAFMIAFARLLGFGPDTNFSPVNCIFDLREGTFQAQAPFHRDYLDASTSLLLDQFIECNMEDQHTICVDKSQRALLLDKLIDFYKIQQGDFGTVKSLEVYKDIFN